MVSEVISRKTNKGYTFSGFPILNDDDKLVGILTSADIKFAGKKDVKVSDIMTKTLITAGPDTTLQQAYDVMMKNKIGKLPLVYKDLNLRGLYSFTDVRALIEELDPMVNRDKRYRLLAGAAVGPGDEKRVDMLADEDVDVLVVDTAHGHSAGVINMTTWIKKHYPDIDVVAGNIATGEAALALLEAGADAVKVGIGPGSICTTRVIAGVGVPQITAIYNVRKALNDEIPIIADGGIRHSGDVPKAITAGANCVMMGSILAGTEESPGEKIIHQGRQYVTYRGMGSLAAMKEGQGSKDRYAQSNTQERDLVPEGIEGIVPYAGTLKKVLIQFAGGLRSSMGYCGCRTIEELREKGRFTRITLAGLNEAHPHDVKIMKEAPNYRS
jgi:IMP dehydrogenase